MPDSIACDEREGLGDLPKVGSMFLGFRLEEEIGRGAFSRVYLARQGDLADRPVVLKVTTDSCRESATLARLQHANIVPIHSVHRSGKYHAVCMPYFGTTTLVDVYRGLEGMPTLPNSGRDLFTTLNTKRTETLRREQPLPSDPAAATRGPLPILTSLDGLSYVEAVLWLTARLANGLAHAHAHGVIHRDLKPANILLSDSGVPMILDFNLAGEDGPSGGTPPYMSPEQLDGFAGQPREVDDRTDLYSLGVVVYELLTRRSPFTRYSKADSATLKAMSAERKGPPPRLRKWNRAVSPAAESIVRHLLEPDPARRYQSARQVAEDIEHHLSDRPLRYAPEPSLTEQVLKWRRRNRSLASKSGLATAAVAIIAFLFIAYTYWGGRLARMEAADTYRQFLAEAQTGQIQAFDRHADRTRLEEVSRLCELSLARYRVLEKPDWYTDEIVTGLPAADRERLREEVGRLLFLHARVTARLATLDAGRADPLPALRHALTINDAALACYAGRTEPRALWDQRAQLARMLGHSEDARRFAQQAAELPAATWSDRFLLAQQYASQGNHRKALPLLQELTSEGPGCLVAWFARGVCHLELMQDAEAVGCFNACIALRPDHPWAWYHRGLAERRLRKWEKAREDFDRVIALQPEFAPAYVSRARVRHEAHDYEGAIEDLGRALELGGSSSSILFRRSMAHRLAGHTAAAQDDLARAIEGEPVDEDGFIERGLMRASHDPNGALADFDAALRLNPRSYRALKHKAALLADRLGNDAEALKVTEVAIRYYPDAVLLRASHGLLLARNGQAARAADEARAVSRLEANSGTLYQLACVYALLSHDKQEYRAQALQLLSAALVEGEGRDPLDTDADLNVLPALPEFRIRTGAN